MCTNQNPYYNIILLTEVVPCVQVSLITCVCNKLYRVIFDEFCNTNLDFMNVKNLIVWKHYNHVNVNWLVKAVPPQSSTLTIMVCSTYHSSNFLQKVVTERMCVCAIIKLCILFGGTHLLVVPWEVVWGSTCGSHGHSHHRIGAGHRSLRCHRSDMTYTQYTASDRCAQFEPKTQKIAYKMDELRRKKGERERDKR